MAQQQQGQLEVKYPLNETLLNEQNACSVLVHIINLNIHQQGASIVYVLCLYNDEWGIQD